MKKSKLLIASILVSASLATMPASATTGKKDPPLAPEIQATQSFSDWFMSLFDF